MSHSTEIAVLAAELTEHDRRYRAGEPTITDFEFDAKIARLRTLDAAHPLLHTIGSDLTEGWTKVKHISPMLSLDNVFDASDVQNFFGGGEQAVEPKIDGLSLELQYVDGLLSRAVTRGRDGVGDDVTANARQIASIPQTLPRAELINGNRGTMLRVRGEVYMGRAAFAALNAQREIMQESLMANPRNAAAGSLKQKDPSVTRERNLGFLAYWTSEAFDQDAQHAFLSRLGFTTAGCVVCSSLDDVMEAILAVKSDNAAQDFDIDGAVIKVRSYRLQQELGMGSKSPKWACAFKYPPSEVETVLQDVEVTVGRTGQICPNARLKPVLLDGSTVKNASLMNSDELERIGNPAIGDIVVVSKSAMIIPRVTGVRKCSGNKPWRMPTVCPSCSTPLERQVLQTGEKSVHWFCPAGIKCNAQAVAMIAYAVGKGALDWDGFGDAQIQQFISAGYRTFAAIFALPEAEVNKILKGAAAKKFLAERERVKSVALWRKYNSLGIDGIGAGTSKDLARKFPNILALCEALPRKHTDVPSAVDQLIGASKANALAAGLFALTDGTIDVLDECGFKFEEQTETSSGKLAGLLFVITGALASGSREAVAARIEAAGGTVKSSVSKKVDYLVVGEAPGGNKVAAAEKHGTKQLNEAALYALLGTEMPLATCLPEDREV